MPQTPVGMSAPSSSEISGDPISPALMYCTWSKKLKVAACLANPGKCEPQRLLNTMSQSAFRMLVM